MNKSEVGEIEGIKVSTIMPSDREFDRGVAPIYVRYAMHGMGSSMASRS